MNRKQFRSLLSSIVAQTWHIHQASGMGLMPMATKFIAGELKGEFDDLEPQEGVSPEGLRFVEKYQKFGAEAYVSDRDTWYYDNFPVKLGNVLMIPVIGAITQEDYCGTAGTQTIMGWYAKAEADPDIKAVIEVKNTPGGEVFGTRTLADFKAKFSKPIVGYCQGMECSAGLYIGATDTYKFTAHDAIIGSCGVMTSFADWSGWYEKNGIKVTDLYSKTSPKKNDAYRRAMDGDFKGYTDGILFKLDQSFMNFMKQHRPNISKEALEGADYISEEAIENGLVDAIGTFDDAYNKAVELSQNLSQNSNQNLNNRMKTIKMEVPAAISGAIKALGGKEIVEENKQDTTPDTPEDTPDEEPEAEAETTKPGAAAQAPAKPDANAEKIADLEQKLKAKTAEFETYKAAAGKTNPAAQRSAARAQEAEKTPEENEAKASAKMEGEDAFMAQFYIMK